MRNALVVAWKEFRTFFQTPIGYVILFVFTLFGGWFFFEVGAGGKFFLQKEASVRGLLTWLPWLFLVFAPVITMRSWAEERRTGTIETLLTLPLTDWQIVIGKFLAAFGLVAVWLICLTPIAGVVAWFGEPDPGPVLGGFIGALLLGGAYAAIGITASALTENQIISMVVGVAGAFFFLLVGFDPVVGLFPESVQGFLYNLSLSTHFHSISRGVLDSRDLLYYVSFIAFFLVANVWAVRKHKGGGLTVALTGAILLVANYLGQGQFFRIDLTENNRYTLASDTKRLLGRLEDDLRLTAYLSSDVPAEFTNLRRDIEDLVREIESYAGGHLRVEIADPAKNEEVKKAAESAGIRPIEFNVAGSDKFEIKAAYLGLVIEYGDKTEKLPAIGRTEMLEYDLMRRIAKMTRRDASKVAWQVSDPFGGMEIPGMPRPPSSDRHTPTTDLRTMDQVLKQEYETTTVDLKSKVPDDVKTVLLCNADTLTEVQKFHLDQFLMRGGGIVVMADGTEPMTFGGMGQRGSPFNRTASEKLPADFFSHYGFEIHKDVVADRACLQIPMPVDLGGLQVSVRRPYPPGVLAVGDFIDQEHPISSRFERLAFLWSSSIELDPKPGVKAFPLVRSTDKAKHLEGFIDVGFERVKDESSDLMDIDTYDQQFLLAGLLEGEFQSYFVAHEVPKEVIDGTATPADEPGHAPAIPFGDLVEPIDDAAHAKEHAEPIRDEPGDAGTDGAKPADEAPKDPAPPDESSKDEATPPSDDDAPAGDESPESGDVPGGGLLRQEDPAAPAAQDPAAPVESTPPAEAAPKKEFEYLKKSTATGRIFVIGTSEFVTDTIMGAADNDLFLQSIVDYMSAESLSTLRAKRIDQGVFAEPSDAAIATARALGWFATPVLLLGLGIFVYVWRRTIRPARARSRMASAAAS